MIDATLPIKKTEGKLVYLKLKVVDHSIAKTKYESIRTRRESKIKSFYQIEDSFCILFMLFAFSSKDLPHISRAGDIIKVTGAKVEEY